MAEETPLSGWPHWAAVLAPDRGKPAIQWFSVSASPSYFSAFLWTGRKQSATVWKMPDGDHVRFLLSFLSDSPLVPQGEDGQGRERLLSNHCAGGIVLLTSS